MAAIGALLLYWFSRQHAGNELTFDRARFMAVNALTGSGFQIAMSLNSLPRACWVVALLLTLAGAMFPLAAGGLAIVRILRLPFSDAQVVRSAAFLCGMLPLAAALPLIESGRDPLAAFMLSASAVANSGLYVGRSPGMWEWQVQALLLPLAIIGSLGLPVLLDCRDALLGRRRLCEHSRIVLAMTAGLYLLILALLLVVRLGDPREPSMLAVLVSSSTAAINSRTFGLPLEYAQQWAGAVQWILLLAMVVGGSPGGTAGGLKTTTLVVLYRGARRSLRGEAPGRVFGIGLVWTAIYGAIVIVTVLALSAGQPQLSPARLIFESVSAVSNVGLSMDTISMVRPGLDLLGLAALLGRIAPIMVLWWMARTTRDADLAVG